MGDTVLITGVGGFIGYHLASACIERGMRVIGIGRTNSRLVTKLRESANFDFAQADIRSKAEVDRAFTVHADVIYHLAAQPYSWFANSNPSADFYTNAAGTVNILERARALGPTKLVFPSTGDVYEETYLASESSPTESRTFYGLSKITAENYIKLYHDFFDLRYTILRIGVVYGPFFNRNVLFDLMNGLLRNGDVTLHTSLDSEYDFLYVDDLVRALIQAQSAEWDSETLNISTGQGIRVSRLVDIMAEYAPVAREKVKGPDGKTSRKVYRNDKAKKLGWRPICSIEEGIRKTLAWLQGEIHNDSPESTRHSTR